MIHVNEARAWLRANGVTSPGKIDEVIDGFDFGHPVYIRSFEPGEDLYQYIRLPSATGNSPMAGEWFCLKGATTAGLAIIDGNTGRRLHHYRVARDFQAMEGTARNMPINWGWSGGGPGGLTQVYIPAPLVRASLQPVGAAERP
jgi:hypothetical protein